MIRIVRHRMCSKRIMAYSSLANGRYKAWREYSIVGFGAGVVGLSLIAMFSEESGVHAEEKPRGSFVQKVDKSIVSSLPVWNGRCSVIGFGSNRFGIVAPGKETTESFRTAQRMDIFDGEPLREVASSEAHAAAVDRFGNIVQWGIGFDKANKEPQQTLTGHDVVSVVLTDSMVAAKTKAGRILLFPARRTEQQDEIIPAGWLRWSLTPILGYTPSMRSVKATAATFDSPLKGSEKIVDVKAGKKHVVVLTNRGRVFQCRPSVDNTRFSLVDELRDPCIGISCGAHHTLIVDNQGCVFGWGDNASGQLSSSRPDGDYDQARLQVSSPQPIYRIPGKALSVYSGGCSDSSFVVVERTDEEEGKKVGDIEIWSCGKGISGQLGHGRFKHAVWWPGMIKAISNRREYSDVQGTIIPIHPHSLSVGERHAVAVMDGVTSDVYGRDVLFWGACANGECLTGKRSAVSEPGYALWKLLDPGKAVSESEDEEERLMLAPKRIVKASDGLQYRVLQSVVVGADTTLFYDNIVHT